MNWKNCTTQSVTSIIERVLKKPIYFCLLTLTVTALGTTNLAQATTEHKETKAEKIARYKLTDDASVVNVIVKFKDGSGIRMRNGELRRWLKKKDSLGIEDSVIDAQLVEVTGLARGQTLSLKRLFDRQEEQEIDVFRASGEKRTGKTLVDLNLYQVLNLPEGMTYKNIANLLKKLNRLDIVDIAYAEPNAVLANIETTPDYEGDQGYLYAPPNGINATYAWSMPGGRGEGVKVMDVEADWRDTHDDLPSLFYSYGTFYNNLKWRNHGTAVLGVIAAQDNGHGMTGIASDASVGVASFISNGVATAISASASKVDEGGIVLIEVQKGPAPATSPCTCAAYDDNDEQCNLLPVEYWSAEFDAIQLATANGRIVVEAAGNGQVNLDHPDYNDAFDRNVRDSGAILVGAGMSDERSPQCWTNYGDRVDVHGWGDSVVTLGYGDLWDGGSEDSYYTEKFGGTSSATPIVSGAAASIQGIRNASGLVPLSSVEMRDLLSTTGTPQSDELERNIGSLPNIETAVANMDQTPLPDSELLCPSTFDLFKAGLQAHDANGSITLGYRTNFYGDTSTLPTDSVTKHSTASCNGGACFASGTPIHTLDAGTFKTDSTGSTNDVTVGSRQSATKTDLIYRDISLGNLADLSLNAPAGSTVLINSLTAPYGNDIWLTAGDYWIGSLEIYNSLIHVSGNGTVRLFVADSVDNSIGYRSKFNWYGTPDQMLIYAYGDLEYAGNVVEIKGYVYAKGDATITYKSRIIGSLAAANITLNSTVGTATVTADNDNLHDVDFGDLCE